MKSFNALARMAYAQYRKRFIEQNLPGLKVPPDWAGLTHLDQAAWIEAVKEVLAEFRKLH